MERIYIYLILASYLGVPLYTIPLSQKAPEGNIVACYIKDSTTALDEPTVIANLDDLDLDLCTHLIYSAAHIDAVTLDVKIPVDIAGVPGISRLTSRRPMAGVILSVIPQHSMTSPFSWASFVDYSARADFASNLANTLLKRELDGVDLVWLPVNTEGPDYMKDMAVFCQLVQEVKHQLEEVERVSHVHLQLIITLSVIPGSAHIDYPSCFKTMTSVVDMVITMDAIVLLRDMDGSDVRISSGQLPTEFYLSNETLASLLRHIETPRKLVIGLPIHGQRYALDINQQVTEAGPRRRAEAVAARVAEAEYTVQGQGTLPYHKICRLYASGGWRRTWDAQIVQPVISTDDYKWIVYEDTFSLEVKGLWIHLLEIGGMAVWSLDDDDYLGACKQGHLPLLHTLLDAVSTYNDFHILGTPDGSRVQTQGHMPGIPQAGNPSNKDTLRQQLYQVYKGSTLDQRFADPPLHFEMGTETEISALPPIDEIELFKMPLGAHSNSRNNYEKGDNLNTFAMVQDSPRQRLQGNDKVTIYSEIVGYFLDTMSTVGLDLSKMVMDPVHDMWSALVGKSENLDKQSDGEEKGINKEGNKEISEKQVEYKNVIHAPYDMSMNEMSLSPPIIEDKVWSRSLLREEMMKGRHQMREDGKKMMETTTFSGTRGDAIQTEQDQTLRVTFGDSNDIGEARELAGMRSNQPVRLTISDTTSLPPGTTPSLDAIRRTSSGQIPRNKYKYLNVVIAGITPRSDKLDSEVPTDLLQVPSDVSDLKTSNESNGGSLKYLEHTDSAPPARNTQEIVPDSLTFVHVVNREDSDDVSDKRGSPTIGRMKGSDGSGLWVGVRNMSELFDEVTGHLQILPNTLIRLRRSQGEEEPSCTYRGVRADPEDCRFYYQCSSGQLYHFFCGQTAVFDPTVNSCVSPNLVKGCETVNTIPHPPDTTARYLCTNDGYFRNPDDCTTFYRCSSGLKYFFRCPHGLVFDENTLICDYPIPPDCRDHMATPLKLSQIGQATNKHAEAPFTVSDDEVIPKTTSMPRSLTTRSIHVDPTDEVPFGVGTTAIPTATASTMMQPTAANTEVTVSSPRVFVTDPLLSNEGPTSPTLTGTTSKDTATIGSPPLGPTASDLAHKIMYGSPDVSNIPARTPPNLSLTDDERHKAQKDDSLTGSDHESDSKSDHAIPSKLNFLTGAKQDDVMENRKVPPMVLPGDARSLPERIISGQKLFADPPRGKLDLKTLLRDAQIMAALGPDAPSLQSPPPPTSQSSRGLLSDLPGGLFAYRDTPLGFVCDQDGYYRDPVDCRKFYQCANGLAHHRHCNERLVFNTRTNICDWPKAVPECQHEPSRASPNKRFATDHSADTDTGERERDLGPGSSLGSSALPTRVQHAVTAADAREVPAALTPPTSASLTTGKIPLSGVTGSVFGTTIIPPIVTIPQHYKSDFGVPAMVENVDSACVAGEYQSDAEDCSIFYICSYDGNKYQFRCPEDLVFNEVKGYCEAEHNVPRCQQILQMALPTNPPPTDSVKRNMVTRSPLPLENPTAVSPDSGFQCPDSGTPALHPDPYDCRKFYECAGGVKRELWCPPGTVYDIITWKCELHELLPQCAGPDKHVYKRDDVAVSTVTPYDATYTGEESTSSRHGNEFPCPSDGVYGHPDKCSIFYHCWLGQATPMKCAPQYAFRQDIRACDQLHNVKGCQNNNNGSISNDNKIIDNSDNNNSSSSSNNNIPVKTNDQNNSYMSENNDKLSYEIDNPVDRGSLQNVRDGEIDKTWEGVEMNDEIDAVGEDGHDVVVGNTVHHDRGLGDYDWQHVDKVPQYHYSSNPAGNTGSRANTRSEFDGNTNRHQPPSLSHYSRGNSFNRRNYGTHIGSGIGSNGFTSGSNSQNAGSDGSRNTEYHGSIPHKNSRFPTNSIIPNRPDQSPGLGIRGPYDNSPFRQDFPNDRRNTRTHARVNPPALQTTPADVRNKQILQESGASGSDKDTPTQGIGWYPVSENRRRGSGTIEDRHVSGSRPVSKLKDHGSVRRQDHPVPVSRPSPWQDMPNALPIEDSDYHKDRAAFDCTGPGYRRHPFDCTLFYKCEGKARQRLYQCQNRLVFNPRTSQCDNVYNVRDCLTYITEGPEVPSIPYLEQEDTAGLTNDGMRRQVAPPALSTTLYRETQATPDVGAASSIYGTKAPDSSSGKLQVPRNNGFQNLRGSTTSIIPNQGIQSQSLSRGYNPYPIPQQQTEVTASGGGSDNPGLRWRKVEPRVSQDNRQTAVNDFVCPYKDLFPHPRSCEYYIDCTDAPVMQVRCPGSSVFNRDTLQCDDRENVVGCPESVSSPNRGQEGVDRANLSDRRQTDQGLSGEPCRNLSIFPDKKDRRRFHQCVQNEMRVNYCPPGLVFHPHRYVCDASTQEGSRRHGTQDVREPADGADVVTDEDDIFRQWHGTTSDRSRDGSEEVVVEARDGGKRQEEDRQMETTGGHDHLANKLSRWPECPERGYSRHPSDCGIFYYCSGPRLYQFHCPERLAFHPDKVLCDYPNRVPGCEHMSTDE